MAANYGMITTGGGCSRSGAVTLEDGVLAVAAGIKAKNAKALVSGELQRAHGGGKCIKAKRPLVHNNARKVVVRPWEGPGRHVLTQCAPLCMSRTHTHTHTHTHTRRAGGHVLAYRRCPRDREDGLL